MPRVDPNFIRHELNVLLDAWPVKQRGRRSAAEHVDAVIEEVEKLKEVLYPSCLSNTVVVKKRMVNGESASTSQASTELVQMIAFHFRRLISWWTLPQVMPG